MSPPGRLIFYAVAALLLYAFLCLLVVVFQRKMIYFPWRWDSSTARAANPGYEDVWILTRDGERLHGWLHERSDPSWTVVIFHGNGGNLAVQEALMHPFVALDQQVVLFDYRGFGLSTGAPSEEGLVRDGEAVVEFLQQERGIDPARMVYFGKSLGTGVATRVAASRPPGRLILESSFDSLVSVGRHHYGWLPVRWLLRDRFESLDAMEEISCPILFFHPERDEIIPVDLGRRLFEASPEPKSFVLIPGAHHNDPPESFPPLYLTALSQFLEEEGGGPASP